MTDMTIGDAVAVLVAVDEYPTHSARHYELGETHIQVNLDGGSDDAAQIAQFLAMADEANGSLFAAAEARP